MVVWNKGIFFRNKLYWIHLHHRVSFGHKEEVFRFQTILLADLRRPVLPENHCIVCGVGNNSDIYPCGSFNCFAPAMIPAFEFLALWVGDVSKIYLPISNCCMSCSTKCVKPVCNLQSYCVSVTSPAAEPALKGHRGSMIKASASENARISSAWSPGPRFFHDNWISRLPFSIYS